MLRGPNGNYVFCHRLKGSFKWNTKY
jgi:hypothetical protein